MAPQMGVDSSSGRRQHLDLGSIDIPQLQKGHRAHSAAIRLARAAGNSVEGLRLAGNLALLGQDIARSGTLVSTLVGLSAENGALIDLAEILQGESFPAEEVAHLASRLARLRTSRPSLDLVWTLERMVFAGFVADDALFDRLAVYSIPDPGSSLRTWRSLYSIRVARANALRGLELLPETFPVTLDTKPWETSLERFLAAQGISTTDPLLTAHLSIWSVLLRSLRERDTHASVLELAVAMARFEAAQGRWPTSPSELVPAYLTAIPTSPYDPGGLRFDGNKAWSRGPDGDDDGGRPLPDPKTMDGDGDVVVGVRGRR